MFVDVLMFSFGGFNCFNFSDTSVCGPEIWTSHAVSGVGDWPIFMGLLYLSPIFSTVGKSHVLRFFPVIESMFWACFWCESFQEDCYKKSVHWCQLPCWFLGRKPRFSGLPNRSWWNYVKDPHFPIQQDHHGWKQHEPPGIGICSQRAEGGHFSPFFARRFPHFFWGPIWWVWPVWPWNVVTSLGRGGRREQYNPTSDKWLFHLWMGLLKSMGIFHRFHRDPTTYLSIWIRMVRGKTFWCPQIWPAVKSPEIMHLYIYIYLGKSWKYSKWRDIDQSMNLHDFLKQLL